MAGSARRAPWQHPAVWFAILVLAALLLVGALLEGPPSPPREPTPDPDAVTALASQADQPGP